MFSAWLGAQHLDHHSDTLGQFIVNVISVRGETILVANVYGDACTDLNSLNTMTRLNTTIQLFAGQYGIDHYLIGGDYNFVLHPADSRSTSRKIRAQNKFATIMSACNTFDISSGKRVDLVQRDRDILNPQLRILLRILC